MGRLKNEPISPYSYSAATNRERDKSASYKFDQLANSLTRNRFGGGGAGTSFAGRTPAQYGPRVMSVSKIKPTTTVTIFSSSSSSSNSNSSRGCLGGLSFGNMLGGNRNKSNAVPNGSKFAERDAYMRLVQSIQEKDEQAYRQAQWISGVSIGRSVPKRVQKSTQPLLPSYRPVPAIQTYARTPFQKKKPQETQRIALQRSRESHDLVKKLFKEFDNSIVEDKPDGDDEIITEDATATTPPPSTNSIMKSVLDRKATPYPKAGISTSTSTGTTGRDIRLYSVPPRRTYSRHSYSLNVSSTNRSVNENLNPHAYFTRASFGPMSSQKKPAAGDVEPETISLSSNSSESVKEIKPSNSSSSSNSSWISNFSEGVKISEARQVEREPKDGSSESDDDIRIVAERIVSPHSRRNSINSLELETNQSPYCKKSWLEETSTRYKTDQQRRYDEICQHTMAIKILQTESDLGQSRDKRTRENLMLSEIIVLEEPKADYPHITDEMQVHIDRALKYGNPNEVLATAFNIQITRGDLKTLTPCQWLNDNVINTYMDMIAENNRLEKGKFPSVHVFTTFFYPKFLKEGYSNVLKRWTRKVDIFSFDLLLFPIHLGIHWCLAAADLRTKTIRYYDSLLGKQTTCVKALLNYLTFEMRERKKVELNHNEWTLELVHDIPTQENGSDCGVFTCKFAQYLARDADLTFGQEQMNYFRYRMVYEIMKQDLLFP